MNTSRFQLGLIATLAAGLGFSVASSDAIGYPAAAVSYENNPIWSTGGRTGSRSYEDVATAPAAQDLIVTDIAFGMDSSDYGNVYLQRSGGEQLAQYVVSGRNAGAMGFVQSMSTGLRVPAGETLQIKVGGDAAAYTLSGYYAQP